LFFFGCSKEYDNEELANSEFETYLNFFLYEASIRGYDFSNHKVNFYFADIVMQDAGGLCYGDSRIVIDRTDWENRKEPSKEWLIFHELGHCILGRGHRNEKSPSGECLSFMKGQENGFECSENLYSIL